MKRGLKNSYLKNQKVFESSILRQISCQSSLSNVSINSEIFLQTLLIFQILLLRFVCTVFGRPSGSRRPISIQLKWRSTFAGADGGARTGTDQTQDDREENET